MTKIKNTKKGMAKKTLSMSLVVAMLATSNVPVWAAEFSDGTDAAVTSDTEVSAPVVTDNTIDEFSDAVATTATEEAPVVEDTTANAAQIDTAEDVNLEDYTVKDLKMDDVSAWGTAVSVTGSIQDNGVDVTGFNYTWMADGVQAAGTGAVGTTSTGNVETISYNPTIEDFQKTLSLRIYKVGKNGSVIFSQTITGGVVQAKDISNDISAELSFDTTKYTGMTGKSKTVIYNGEEQKVSATNTYTVTKDSIGGKTVTIDNKNIDWHYETKTNDYTNVTKKNIKVYGTIVGTTDRSSAAYGYTGTTASAEYQITPFVVDANNYDDVTKVTLLKTSVEYTGTVAHKFSKKDIKLEINVSNDSTKEKKVDITAALKDDLDDNSIVGNGVTTGESFKATAKLFGQFDDSDAATEILKNFKFDNVTTNTVTTTNKYAITKRDLSKCTAVIKKEYNPSAFRGEAGKIADLTTDAAYIELTDAEGQTFTLSQILDDVVVQINSNVFNAANANPVQTGTMKNGVTIGYKNDSLNVTGSLNADLNLVVSSLAYVNATVSYRNNSTTDTSVSLGETKADAANVSVPYTGKAYDIEDTKAASTNIKYDVYNVSFTGLDLGAYAVSYNDNVNAGTVEVTLTGKGNYAGSTKKFYFTIDKDAVSASEFKATSDTVTINPSNNKDASLYKDAIKPVFKTALADGTNTILEEGKDYTVKYYYGKDGAASVDDLTGDKAGANKVDDYVYAVATLAKKGNYESSDSFIFAKAKIAKKSISNVTVTVDKDSYVYTGKEIVPDVTVKDGSVTLVKGEDYTLKFKDNINVGTATAYVVPTGTSDYATNTSATTTFKIEAAKAEDVKVTLKANTSSAVSTDNTFPYTGKQVKPVIAEVTLNGQKVTDDFDIEYPTYGENVNAGKEAGSITITPKTSNFTGTKTQLFNIQGKELTGALKVYNTDKSIVGVWSDIAYHTVGLQSKFYSFYYDGTAQTFGSEVFTADATLSATKDKDYEIKYINNTDAGYAFVAVVAKGNYEANTRTTTFNNLLGDYKVTAGKLYKGNKVIQNNIVDIIAFNIEPSYFTAKNITVANGTYAGGIPVKPQVTVTVNGKTLVEGTDYTLTLTAIKGEATPDKFVDVTTDKPYYVTINAKGGYKFDQVNGTNTYVWGIDKKDLKDCFVKVVKDGEKLDTTVMNGNVVETKENFDVKDNGDGTATVSVVDGGKSYTGSATVTVEDANATGAVGTAMISNVKVSGNKATVVLSDSVDNAAGYDYVIATEEDVQNGRVDIVKNQVKTSADFTYVQEGTYYAYCHAWKRGADGKKVFGDWSNIYKFEVTAKTPSQPVITSVKVKGSDITVTYTKASAAKGYDVVLGTAARKVNGEYRPVEYGTLVKKNLGADTVSVTFKNVEAGTYYAGLHAFNRTSADNTKVFSKWSNVKKVTVK